MDSSLQIGTNFNKHENPILEIAFDENVLYHDQKEYFDSIERDVVRSYEYCCSRRWSQ